MASRIPPRGSAHSMRETARHRRRRSHTKRNWWIGFGVFLVVVVGVGAWVGTRALIVKSDLETAQSLVTQMQAEAGELHFDALDGANSKLLERSASAVAHAHDPFWRVAEVVPVVGENLTAVRVVAESIDDIARKVAAPAVEVASTFDLGARDASTGGFDLAPLTKAKGIIASAQSVFGEAQQKLAAIDTAKTVGQVRAAVAKLNGLLTKASAALDDASELVNVAGSVLGQDGPRSYLLAFQNNAESTALGGSAASFTLLSVDKGAIKVAGQAGSADFRSGDAVDVPVDQSALDLYSEYLVDHLNTSTSRPDFPTAAEIMRAYWLRDQGATVDGVISVDPLALAHILKATGPITLSSGDVLSSDNAVSLLVNEIYFRYDSYKEPQKVDAFFQEAASSILDAVTSGHFDLKAMIGAVTAGVDQGSIMMWSANPDEQALLDGKRIQGVLPKANDKATVIGAYYRDTSASKIDYYLQTKTHTTADLCTAPAAPTFSTAVTLHSNLTPDQANALPAYVRSGTMGPQMTSTQVFVYGPVGAAVSGTTVDPKGPRTKLISTTVDLGRPVAAFVAYLAPGQSSTVNVSFTGTPGKYGPVEMWGTPMINKTARTLDQPACG